MSNSTLREALEQLIACHNEPECPAIAVAQAALAADDVVQETMREQFEACWVITMDADDAARQASQAAAPQAGLTDAEVAAAIAEVASAPQEFDIYLDEESSALLRDTIGDGDASAVRIQFGNGHSGPGLYVSLAEHPEEGSIKLWDSPIATAPQSVEPVWYRWRYNGEWHSGPTPLLREDQTHVEALYLAPPTAPTDAEWQEEAMRLADALNDAVRRAPRSVSASEHRDALRAHIATRPLPAPPTKKEQP